MTKKVYRSKCCNAKVRTAGVPDFLGGKEICTFSYTCLKCNKPCDVADLKGQKRKVCATEKSKGEKGLDFQGKILQKLVELLDGITIDPVKGVILTPKKKRQLVELQKLEQKLFK